MLCNANSSTLQFQILCQNIILVLHDLEGSFEKATYVQKKLKVNTCNNKNNYILRWNVALFLLFVLFIAYMSTYFKLIKQIVQFPVSCDYCIWIDFKVISMYEYL